MRTQPPSLLVWLWRRIQTTASGDDGLSDVVGVVVMIAIVIAIAAVVLATTETEVSRILSEAFSEF